MQPILSLRNLTLEYSTGVFWGRRRFRVLNDVSCDVAAGEALGIAGESGCGKTSLARCAVGLVRPTRGSVFFEGTDLAGVPPAQLRTLRRAFQMIFQDPLSSMNPSMRTGDILAEPLAAHRIGTPAERERRVLELMRMVSLDPGVRHARPRALSGGQQQRVVIARALALEPRLLIADEPVSALDPSVQAQIMNLLAHLRRSLRLTLVLISHSLPVLHYLCSRIAVMYLGRIVEEAPVREFFAHPAHPYSRMLIASVVLPGTPADAGGVAPAGDLPSPLDPPPGCPFHPRCPEAMPRCRSEKPDWVQAGANKVACWLYS